MAIQLFMQATMLMSNLYGYPAIEYDVIRERSARAGFSTLPFMPPETVRATPELRNFVNEFGAATPTTDFIVRKYGYKPLVQYYIRTGLRASQIVCRNYLLGLEERNQYLEFLQREFGVIYALASGILAAVNANGTLANAFLISRTGVDEGINAYQEYRFLNIDREAARVVVETAQNKLAEFYLRKVNDASNDIVGGYTFSDALNAVSVIEYQCTRSGIRALLNRSITNTPTNLAVDEVTGTIFFKSSVEEVVTVPSDAPGPGPGGRPAPPGNGGKPDSGRTETPAPTCPPSSARLASEDANTTKLKNYLDNGPGTRQQREENLQRLLDRPEIKRLLIPNKPRPLPIVITFAGCEAVRQALVEAAQL